MLESSNVNIVEELVEMIEAQRAYEISSKMVSAVDEMLRRVDFAKIHSGWPYSYCVLAALWNAAAGDGG